MIKCPYCGSERELGLLSHSSIVDGICFFMNIQHTPNKFRYLLVSEGKEKFYDKNCERRGGK